MKKATVLAALLFALVCTLPLLGQTDTGELRLTVTDPAGLGVKSAVKLVNEAAQYHENLETDETGYLEVKRLPFGTYQLTVESQGFAAYSQAVEIRSAAPEPLSVKLSVSEVTTEVTVSAAPTLVDPHQTTSVKEIGTETIENRVTSLPGRSLQELINDQPGWLFEGNDVLHPRGAENQTQFVVDGIPLTDNRSTGFAPEVPAEDVEDAKVYTAGYSAEYGRRLGGVISIDTLGANEPGLHGHTVLSGGSYDTASAYSELQYTWKGNTIGLSGNGSRTNHYLNPVVPENFHNAGTTGSWAGSFERDLTPKDRITMTVRHGLARFQIPNELVQENGGFIPTVDSTSGEPCPPVGANPDCVFIPGGQRNTADNFETFGTVVYQHIFSPNAIGWLRGMVREKERDYRSNALAWPIGVFQNNEFKEGYFSASLSLQHGRHDWKFGIENDSKFLHENFRYLIPDCTAPDGTKDVTIPQCPLNPDTVALFDPATPLAFAFTDDRPNLEQAAYVQDTIHLGDWTVNAGLRWDHYQLVVNQNAVSPRVSVARFLRKPGAVVHFSYDRTFQPPDFENILLSSSAQIASLNPNVLRLPVEPSHGNFYEAGVTKGFNEHLRVDVNYFLRRENNVADDDTLLSTLVAFPIAWDHDVIYGAEAKVTVPTLWHFSGWVSYAYQVANVFFPIRGGLLLGSEAADLPTTGHFPATQDQRHTVRSRIRYQVIPRLWVAFGADYNSGLPFEATLTESQAAAIYGQAVVSQLNFDRGRILPEWLLNASAGAELYHHKEREMHLQFDVTNLTDRLNVMDFGGLFSETAIGPARSYYARLSMRF